MTSSPIPYIIKNENVAYISNAISKGMYSYPLSSVIREYIANAIDTHKAVGKENIPIDIYLPSHVNPHLIIKDYGEGMSKEFIETSWVSFGTSTKRDNVEQIGKFGLGSKSFAAISDSLTLSSVFNNIKRTYCVHKDSNNIFNLIPLGEEYVNEVNGTTIYIPCDYSNLTYIKKIYDNIIYWTQLLPVKPNIHCSKDLISSTSSISSIDFKYKKLISISNSTYKSRLYVVDNFVNNPNFYSLETKIILSLGGLPYCLSLHDANKYIGKFEYLFRLYNLNNKNSYTTISTFVIEVDPNRICLQEPRESINLKHADTIRYLYNVLYYFDTYLKQYLFNVIDKIKRIDPIYVLGLNEKLMYYCKLPTCIKKGEIKNIYRRFNMYKITTSNIGKHSLRELNRYYKGDITKKDYLYILNDINTDTRLCDKYRKVVKEYLISKGIDEFLLYTIPKYSFSLGKNGRLFRNKYKPIGSVIPLSQIVNKEENRTNNNLKKNNDISIDNKTQVLGYTFDPSINNLNSKGLNRYNKPLVLSRDIEEEVYYIGISHGSILKRYIQDFNKYYFTEEYTFLNVLNKLTDKPIYLIKEKDIPKLGSNFKPINDILNTPEFINARYLKDIYISIHNMYHSALALEYLSYLMYNEHFYDKYITYKQSIIPFINDITDPFIKRLLLFNKKCNEFLNEVKYNDKLTTKMKLLPDGNVKRIDEFLKRIENKLKKDYPLLSPSLYYFYDIGHKSNDLEDICNEFIKYINLIDNKVDNIFLKEDEDILYNLFGN